MSNGTQTMERAHEKVERGKGDDGTSNKCIIGIHIITSDLIDIY